MAMLKPELAILDETDSGLDIDALRIVSEGVNTLAGPELGVLVITHYQRILNYIKPDLVHVLMDGRIVRSGGAELALELEQRATTGRRPAAGGLSMAPETAQRRHRRRTSTASTTRDQPSSRRAQGLDEDVVREISAHEERAAVDARLPPQGARRSFRRKPMPTWGGDRLEASTSRTSTTTSSRPPTNARSWDDVPGRHQAHVRHARHPRGRAEVPRRRRRPVRVRGRLPQPAEGPRGARA